MYVCVRVRGRECVRVRVRVSCLVLSMFVWVGAKRDTNLSGGRGVRFSQLLVMAAAEQGKHAAWPSWRPVIVVVVIKPPPRCR